MEQNTDYTVRELLEQLLADESWEEDAHYRAVAVEMLKAKVFPHA